MQTALIDDILDVSRIMRGKINLTFRSVRMSAVVEAALAAVRPTADAKGVMLEYEMAADSDEISGDADRLQQIVWNLLRTRSSSRRATAGSRFAWNGMTRI